MGRVGPAHLFLSPRRGRFVKKYNITKKKKKIELISKLHVILKILVTSKYYEIKTSEVKV